MEVPPVPPSELQFDKAEFASSDAAATTCAACAAPIAGEYYDVNGRTLCPVCKTQVERALAASAGAAGFMKAVAGGIAGGVVGAIIYFAVLALSGYQIGIIAIAVGWLVGKGVNWGSGGRGGAWYQVLAMGLTYLSIASTYVGMALKEAPAGEPSPPLLVILIVGLALPILTGFQSIIGIIIVGIGLYEAWKINRRVRLEITGPFHAAFRPAAPAAAPPATAAGAAPGS